MRSRASLLTADLEPGKHAYKLIVDGNWLLDPANPNAEDDDYGVKNSVRRKELGDYFGERFS